MIGEDVMAPATEMEQLREQLLRAQRLSSVGTLASSVAHEFNNILTTIINYAKLGLRAESTESTRVQALEKILKGSQRAATIISSMLGFARNHSTQRELIDLVALVDGFLGGDAQAQPRMAPTNHGLVAVVREHSLTLAGHRHRQGVAGRGDTVACRAADADNRVWLVHIRPRREAPVAGQLNLLMEDTRPGPARTPSACQVKTHTWVPRSSEDRSARGSPPPQSCC